MRKLFVLGMALCLLALGAAETDARQATLRIGPGIYLDGSIIGAVGAIDIAVAKEGRVTVGPWVNAFISKSNSKIAAGGVQLLYKIPAGETAKIFFGAGGGGGQVRSGGFDGIGGAYAITAGAEAGAGEKLRFFAQVQAMGVFGGEERVTLGTGIFAIPVTVDMNARHIAIGAGIAFNFGE